MIRPVGFSLLCVLGWTTLLFAAEKPKPIEIADVKRNEPVDFAKDVLPIFNNSCTACHNEFVDEGGLVLETAEATRKGGRRGAAVVPGKADESILLKFAAHQSAPVMPPKDNSVEAKPLKPEELGIIKLWINQGAKGSEAKSAETVDWQPLPAGVNPIYAAALTSDGQYAACGRANQIFIYHVPTGQLVTRLTDPSVVEGDLYSKPGVAHLDIVQSLAFHPDGDLLASGGFRTVKLWRRPQNVKLAEVATGNAAAKTVAVSPDGHWMATGNADQTIKLFDLNAGKPAATLQGHAGEVTDLTFTKDSQKLVSGSLDGSVRVWNLAEQKVVGRIDTPSPVRAVTLVGNEEELLASAGDDNVIYLWKQPSATQGLPDVGSELAAIASTSDQKLLALGGKDGKIRLFDVAERKVTNTLSGHQAPLRSLDFGNNNSQLVSVDEKNRIIVWSVADGQKVLEYGGEGPAITALAMRPNTNQIVSGTQEGKLTVWKLEQADNQWKATAERELSPLPKPVVKLAFHPNGSMVYAVSEEGTLRGFDPNNENPRFNTGHGSAVHDLAVSPNGQWLATAGENKQLRVWNAGNGGNGPKPQLGGFEAPLSAVGFSADSKYVFGGTKDGKILVFPIDQDKPAQAFADHNAEVQAILPLSAEAMLSTTAGKEAKIWPLVAVRQMQQHANPITSLETIPNAKHQIASGSEDGTIRFWDTNNGSSFRQFNHGGPVTGIAINPAGNRLASSSSNNTAKIFDAGNSRQLVEMKGDFRAQQQLALANNELNKAKRQVAEAKKQLDQAEKELPKKEEALKKAQEAKDKANTEYEKEKQATDKVRTEYADAQKVFSDAQGALTKATKAAEEAEAALKQARDAKDEGKIKAAEEAKQKADQAVNEAKKKVDEAEKAVKSLEKKVTDAEKKLQPVEVAKQKADREFEDAEKAFNAAKDAVPAAKSFLAESEKLQKSWEDQRKQAEETVKASEQPIHSIAYSPDGLRLATVGADGAVHTWDGETGQAFQIFEGHKSPVLDVCFVPERTAIASAAADQQAIVWNYAPDWKLERTIGAVSDADTFEHRVISLDFSDDGKLLATGSGEPSRSGQLKLWNVADGSLVKDIPDAHSDTIFGVEFSHDGQYIASCAADKFMKVFNVSTGEMVKSFEGHTHHVLDTSWQWDDEVLATAGADNEIKVWKFETGEQTRTIKNYSKQVTSLEFIGETGDIISCSGDKTVRRHTASNGRQVRTYSGATDFVNSVAITPDANVLIAGGQDSVLYVWNGNNGQSLKTFAAPEPKADKVASSK